ncbi:MAG TPA: hypothetical protein VJZ93_03205 [Candidatus Nanoarchaeia archaeon]|nr:hypothetical protein [Candidatus Nanoarchaeia archaeon]
MGKNNRGKYLVEYPKPLDESLVPTSVLQQSNNTGVVQKVYGDENLGYSVLARDMTPEEAKRYYESSFVDGVAMQMPRERLDAVKLRGEDI